jgi:D-specific alpha-keto acid dehydrogenase
MATRVPVAPVQQHVTVYGCEPDEAELFLKVAPTLGIVPVITAEHISESSIELSHGNQCISIGHKSPVTNDHLTALGLAGVRYISTRSIGFNHVDVDFAASVGITVENSAYSPDSVADHALMVMLMAIRHMKASILRTDAHDYRLHAVRGRELHDLTVGVIGTGRIGTAVIERLKGFGCTVLAFDKYQKAEADYVSLDELLERSDIVTLHAPLDATTHHLLDAARISQLPPGAFVVNTGRGALVDTTALIVALESGHLGGAALDVLEEEDGIFYSDYRDRPVENEALLRLQAMPNVIITPHTAFYTDRALSDTIVNSLSNCLRFEKETQHG